MTGFLLRESRLEAGTSESRLQVGTSECRLQAGMIMAVCTVFDNVYCVFDCSTATVYVRCHFVDVRPFVRILAVRY